MARTVIDQDLIVQMNELYLEIGTYAGVSRALGGSPSPTTVKKYIIPKYTSKKNIVKKVFQKDDLPEFATTMFDGVDNWGDLCSLSKEEKEEIVVLWDELSI
jgi:hypothetical protein